MRTLRHPRRGISTIQLLLLNFALIIALLTSSSTPSPLQNHHVHHRHDHKKHKQQSTTRKNNSHVRYQIRQVQVLTRHGDRTPVHTIPNLPEVTWLCSLPNDISLHPMSMSGEINSLNSPTTPNNMNTLFLKRIIQHEQPLPGNCTMGQLTSIGMKQHYDLGQYFYERYTHSHPDTGLVLWDSDKSISQQILIESTDMPRTIQSAQSQYLGLVPRPNERIYHHNNKNDRNGKNSGNSNEQQHYVTINVQSEGTCDMYPNFVQCPRLSVLRQRVIESESYRQFEKQFAHVKEQVLKNLNLPSFPGWTALYDVFACRHAHNHTLPHGWTQQLVNNITLGAETEYGLLLADKMFLRLSVSPFLKRVKAQMSQVMISTTLRQQASSAPSVAASGNHWHNHGHHIRNHNNNNDSNNALRDQTIRFSLHSGHDTSIAPLASLLGFYDGKWPRYASNIVLELYEVQKVTVMDMDMDMARDDNDGDDGDDRGSDERHRHPEKVVKRQTGVAPDSTTKSPSHRGATTEEHKNSAARSSMRTESSFALKIFYDQRDVTAKVCAKLDDSGYCSWETFDELTEKLIEKEQERQCQV